jgi:hypothetical protein
MLLVLFAASGGHWMVLQSVAWSRMLMSYSQEGRFATAVVKTFDGQHPCALCKRIAQSKAAEPQPVRNIEVETNAVFVAPPLAVMVRKDGPSWRLEIPAWSGERRAEQPMAPPPRSAVA